MTAQTAPLIARARRLYLQGQAREAEGLCRQALQADPRAAEAYAFLAGMAADQRAFGPSVDLFQRALAIDPRNAAWGADLARSLIGLNRQTPALTAALQALALGPKDATTFDTLGVVFSRIGHQANAALCFRRAHELAPTQAGYLLNLGWAEQYLGEFAAAEQSWRRCIALDPDNDAAIAALVQMVTQGPDDNFIPALERLFQRAAGDADRQLRVGHALAKTYEDLKDPLAAFEWLARAKAAKARAATGLAAWQADVFSAARATAPRP
ncbi:MAG TPA: tetratricopeptide repeat protein, partial [Caulobacter sp.]|nr:tetratricopeptide repeat protein [Caulobacter sp.]